MYNKSKEKIAKPILSQKATSNIPRPPSKQATNTLPSIKNIAKPVQVAKRLTSAEKGNKTEKSTEKVGGGYLKKQEGLKRMTAYSGLSSQKSK